MKRYHWPTTIFLLTTLIAAASAQAPASNATGSTSSPSTAETVTVHSGGLILHALLYRPQGQGPFPAVLFNHGSGHSAGNSGLVGGPDHRHPELLGPVFARHGYVFLYLYRRGDGLSAGQGVPSGDRMDDAFKRKGQDGRNALQLKILESDEMNDALAGLAFLRTRPEVDAHRIAVVGQSFGGTLTVLVAARDSGVRAIVTFAPGGYSWDRSPQLRARLLSAVDRMSAAAFFNHAENDYSINPGNELAAEMERVGKPHLVKIYPPVGQTPDEGHDFLHLRISAWEPDVFAFLDRYVIAAHDAR